MLKRVVIEQNYDGIGQLLRSNEVADDLKRRGDAVAAAASSKGIRVGSLSGKGEVPLPVQAHRSIANRARCTIWIEHPAGVGVESKYRVLVRNLRAARG